MSFNKEEERLQFVEFTNTNTLLPFAQVGLVDYQNVKVDFKKAFADLAKRYKDSSDQDSPEVLREAYSVFKKAMRPTAEKRFHAQTDDDPIGYLYLHFMDIEITLENGICISPAPTNVSSNTVSYLDMKHFREKVSDLDLASRAWDVANIQNVVCGRPLSALPKKNGIRKEVPSWLIPRAASKKKLNKVSRQPSLA